MENELQFKPFVPEAGSKYKILEITDITFHTEPKKPTTAIGKKIVRALEQNEPGRIYGSLDNSASLTQQQTAIIELIKKDPKLQQVIQEYEKNGYKVALSIPEQIPILAGQDTQEFINSNKGKGLLRRLAKKSQNN